jgi:hypothetical protein
MQPAQTETPGTPGAHLAIAAAQVVLTLLAVVVSRLGLGGHVGAVAVMGLATVNGLIVALAVLGVRRNGALVSWLALGVVVLIAGLLVWPAWDVAARARVF